MRLKLLGILTAVVTSTALVASLGSPAAAETSSRTSSRSFGYTQVTVAPPVYAVVASAGITPSPVSPGIAFPFRGTLAARFPITGVAAPATVLHRGGLTLAKGAATLTLTDFDIELARLTVSGNVSGSIGDVGRADLFTLGLSNRPALGLLSLRLTATAAGALNQTFGVSAFTAGQTFGYATVVPRFGWVRGDRHLAAALG